MAETYITVDQVREDLDNLFSALSNEDFQDAVLQNDSQNEESFRRSVDIARNALEDTKAEAGNWDSKQLKTAHSAATGTAKAIVDAIDDFKSGDGIKMTKGALSVISAAAPFALLAGPPGIIAATVVGVICIFGGAIVDQVEKKRNQEETKE